MYDIISYAIAVVVLIMVALAYIKNNFILRISTILVLLLMLVGREWAIEGFARSLIWENVEKNNSLGGFGDGIRAIESYCIDTSYVVYVIAIAIFALCIRGFKDK